MSQQIGHYKSLKKNDSPTIRKTYHPILPFCFFTIRASRTALRFRKLTRKGFILNPESLGQHLKSKRLLLNLTQEQVAKQLGTVREQYERWERDEVSPAVSFWPRLIRFLGYYPGPEVSFADWVLKARRMWGLSQYGLGRRINAIASAVRLWEHDGKIEPPLAVLKKIKILADNGIDIAKSHQPTGLPDGAVGNHEEHAVANGFRTHDQSQGSTRLLAITAV
ncbi:helix-turn-helix domain-containing protein [Prosthecobacter sp.]|uniref:helix-turn-helix domain-containing protein n=1 Tax=Prosthecobacter sp. TaxID=1965333 RepID=UPI003783D146